MAIFSSFLDVFKRNSELEWSYDLELIHETSQRAYLKRMALESVLNFLGRSIAKTEFRYYENGKMDKSEWYYKLNVRPNTDMSAATFWKKVIYKLVYDNEVLIVVDDTNNLLIADNYIRKEYALYEDSFSEVTVKDYTFQRSFPMGEVIFLEYNNDKLSTFVDSLFSDYGELFGRMMDVSLRNGQIRSTVSLDQNARFDDETGKKLQKFVDRLFESFSKSSIAIVPKTKGIEYSEESGSSTRQDYSEISALKKDYINDVARMVGIPPALIHGEMADLSANEEAYIKFCIKPLLKQIEDELNAKLFEKEEYLQGSHVDAIGIDKPDVFELATSIDKLIGSGTFSQNEIREKLGEERVDNPKMDKYYVTKNYTEVGTLEGGENE